LINGVDPGPKDQGDCNIMLIEEETKMETTKVRGKELMKLTL